MRINYCEKPTEELTMRVLKNQALMYKKGREMIVGYGKDSLRGIVTKVRTVRCDKKYVDITIKLSKIHKNLFEKMYKSACISIGYK